MRIPVRATEKEMKEIKKRAEAANKSVNRFLIDCALEAAPQNEKKLSDLMGQLCRLEVTIQSATDLGQLKHDVETWRWDTLRIMGG